MAQCVNMETMRKAKVTHKVPQNVNNKKPDVSADQRDLEASGWEQQIAKKKCLYNRR